MVGLVRKHVIPRILGVQSECTWYCTRVTWCVYTSTPQLLMEVSSLTLSIRVYIYIIYIYVPMHKVQHNMVPSNTAVCICLHTVWCHVIWGHCTMQEYGQSFPHFWMAEAILWNGLGTIPTNRAWQGILLNSGYVLVFAVLGWLCMHLSSGQKVYYSDRYFWRINEWHTQQPHGPQVSVTWCPLVSIYPLSTSLYFVNMKVEAEV